ncbi:MAG: M1 family metallopeptidase, partial [Chlorobi bacterium]|nr:M1 family metallopeptidase [Chlorobiota bacterium]
MFLGVAEVSAQKDSIYIGVKLSQDKKMLDVTEEIVYFNNSEKDLNTIKLLNWVAAYNRRGTSLVYRKLEDRNTDLHFAKKNELGKLLNLQVKNSGEEIPVGETSEENIFLPLKEALKPGEKVKLQLQYQIQLPDKKFTGYGTSDNNVALKYFFIVPDRFDPDNISKRD